jgi:hypothetical protein
MRGIAVAADGGGGDDGGDDGGGGGGGGGTCTAWFYFADTCSHLSTFVSPVA